MNILRKVEKTSLNVGKENIPYFELNLKKFFPRDEKEETLYFFLKEKALLKPIETGYRIRSFFSSLIMNIFYF